jgi:hypothetical protein
MEPNSPLLIIGFPMATHTHTNTHIYKQTTNNALIRSGRPYMITKMNDSLKMDSTKVGSINAGS